MIPIANEFVRKAPIKRAKGNIDLTFLVLVLTLLVFGLVMMFSASYAYAYYYENNSFHFITRQLVWAVLGLGAMAFLSTWDYHIWHKFAWLIFGVSVVLLVVVYFMPTRNDAHRWIFIMGQQFQPSEIAKFSIVLLFFPYDFPQLRQNEDLPVWYPALWRCAPHLRGAHRL